MYSCFSYLSNSKLKTKVIINKINELPILLNPTPKIHEL